VNQNALPWFLYKSFVFVLHFLSSIRDIYYTNIVVFLIDYSLRSIISKLKVFIMAFLRIDVNYTRDDLLQFKMREYFSNFFYSKSIITFLAWTFNMLALNDYKNQYLHIYLPLRLPALIDLYIHPLYILVSKILSSILNSPALIHPLYHPLSTLSTVGPTCHFI
jgi:hypothetical protein